MEELLNWFKRGRHCASLEKMTADLGKKQSGKKKSTRKRSNAGKIPVTQSIDILEQDSSGIESKVLQSDMTKMVILSQMSGVIPSHELNAIINQGWYNEPIVSTPSAFPYQGFALN